ncbi:FAD-dependent oxidoreductase [Desulfurella sp.]|uniref:NAD(P)/FAD-dependent oxidoreductase n=1 Tax=Desulfurella sp. TaxID=1962857 RepID=UPI0025C0EF3E|nr:FAD-dependent oxidoreductase [Desulfurella sp.]
MHYDLIIIGNSAAGLSAIKTIRAFDKKMSVAVFDKEAEPAYSRVLTPYYAGFDTDKDHLYIVDESFYPKNGIDAYLGDEVFRVDTNKKTIYTQFDTYTYRYLLIAVGAFAKQSHIKHEKVLTLRNISDADKLRKLFSDAKSVAALGAGLVSLPTLSHLKDDVKKHIIVSSDRIFSQVVDKSASYILEEIFKNKNVFIYKHDDVESIKDNADGSIKLSLKSNHQIDCDLLLVGKGVVPNVDFLKGEIETDKGIVIDDFCKTSAQDVYAAGDCAQGRDFVTGKSVIQGNWITAVEQAIIAAKNILGINVAYDGSIKNNTTEVFGIDVAVVGYNKDDAQNIEFYDPDRFFYRKLFFDESGFIIGATLIKDTNDAGLYYNLVKTRTKIDIFHNLNQFMNYPKFLSELNYR